METYNDFATIAEEKMGEVNQAYQSQQNGVEILSGDTSPNQAEKRAGSTPTTPTNPVASPRNSTGGGNTTPTVPISVPEETSNNLMLLNLLLMYAMLELLYGTNGCNN